MHCTRCSHEVRPKDRFCPNCATATDNFTFDTTNVYQVEPLSENQTVVARKKLSEDESHLLWPNNIGKLLAIGASVLLVGFLIWIGLELVGNKIMRGDANIAAANANWAAANAIIAARNVQNVSVPQPAIQIPSTPIPTPYPTPPPIVQRFQIFSGSEVVAPSSSLSWNFHVGSDSSRVFGHFAADGGLRGEIECFITDAAGAQNIGRGLTGRVWYQSDKVHVQDLDVRLGQGDYVLLFRNPSSWTQRVVRGQISLE